MKPARVSQEVSAATERVIAGEVIARVCEDTGVSRSSILRRLKRLGVARPTDGRALRVFVKLGPRKPKEPTGDATG